MPFADAAALWCNHGLFLLQDSFYLNFGFGCSQFWIHVFHFNMYIFIVLKARTSIRTLHKKPHFVISNFSVLNWMIWFIYLTGVFRRAHEYCAYTTAAAIMVLVNREVLRENSRPSAGLPEGISTYGRRRNQHELELNSNGPHWWKTLRLLQCVSALCDWATLPD